MAALLFSTGWNFPALLFYFLSLLSFLYTRFLTRKARLLYKFPTITALPFIGSVWLLLRNPKPEGGTEVVSYAVKHKGRRSVFWMSHKPYVILADANSVQKVLSSAKLIEKGSDYEKIKWILGDGLITAGPETWGRDRKILMPSFNYKMLVGFIPSFNKNARTLVTVLSDIFETRGEVDQNLHPRMCRVMMDDIAKATLDRETDFQKDIESEFLKGVYLGLDIIRTKIIRPYLDVPIIRDIFGIPRKEKQCKGIFAKYIEEAKRGRLEVLQNNNNDKATEGSFPFIDPLLSPEYESWNLDVNGHITTMFAAGFETTGSSLTYTLFLLALNPACMKKVQEELDTIFSDDPERDVTFNDLADMKYLEMCMKESLRLFPVVPCFFRKLKEDVELDEGLTIPEGVDIFFSSYELHRDPEYFPDPEKFIPERMLPDVCAARHPYAYIPFSMGPRNCVGYRYGMMAMKTTLAHVLRKYSVTTSTKREELKVWFGMVLETAQPILLTLHRRENNLI